MFVEDGGGLAGMVATLEQLAPLEARLNPRGTRERRLRGALDRHRPRLAAAQEAPERPALDTNSIPRSASRRAGAARIGLRVCTGAPAARGPPP